MVALPFSIPVHYRSDKSSLQSIQEAFDGFFYFGRKRGKVLEGAISKKGQKVRIKLSKADPSTRAVSIAFRVFALFTIIIPLIMLIGKIVFRATHSFKIFKANKESGPPKENPPPAPKAIDISPFPIPEFGPRWTLMTPHLPIGITLGAIRAASWNVLHRNKLDRIFYNGQGLRESQILREEDKKVPGNPKLTKRDEKLLEQIKKITEQASLIAIQECHLDLTAHLRDLLPPNWCLLGPPGKWPQHYQEIFLYDQARFKEMESFAETFAKDNPHHILVLTLKEIASGKIYRFIQTQLINEADPIAKWAKMALAVYHPEITLVLMGDMGTSPEKIKEALSQAAAEKKIEQPYKYLANPFPTHIDIRRNAVWHDQIWYASPQEIPEAASPDSFFKELMPAVQLLKRLPAADNVVAQAGEDEVDDV